MDLNIPNHFKQSKKRWTAFCKSKLLICLERAVPNILTVGVWKCWKGVGGGDTKTNNIEKYCLNGSEAIDVNDRFDEERKSKMVEY